jgi:hypothetical protein
MLGLALVLGIVLAVVAAPLAEVALYAARARRALRRGDARRFRDLVRWLVARTRHARAAGLVAGIVAGRGTFDAYAALSAAGAGPTPRSPTPRRRRKAFRLVSDLREGVRTLTHPFEARPLGAFTYERVAALVLFDVALLAALHGTEFSRGAVFDRYIAGSVFAPLLLFMVGAFVAAWLLDAPQAAVRIAGTFYAALPALLACVFVQSRGRTSGGEWAAWGALIVHCGWTLLLGAALARRAAPNATLVRYAASASLVFAAWWIPHHWTAPYRLWEVPMPEEMSLDEEAAHLHALAFEQGALAHAAESALLPERPGVVDLYFVGFAGYGGQDVFLHEIRAAQSLFDLRFDTAGRSLLLANDLSTRGALPMASTVSLGHVLQAVGARMNRDEDVLFLWLTSHGSAESGLTVSAPHPLPLVEEDDLSPHELRRLLDEAGIKWRVVVAAGCESGEFVDVLRDDFTLVATSASSDRFSYGCADGNAFTDFGQAVLGEQLTTEDSFATALTKATEVIAQRETADGRTRSLPRIAVGSAIAEKLASFEQRLAAER